MTNEQRLDEIVSMVEDLTTEEIAMVFFERDTTGRFLCPWPEHSDTNGSSFHLNKNHTFKCFSCGNRPVFSIHDYIKSQYGITDIKQSCLYIAYQCGCINEDEYIKLKTFQENAQTKMKVKYQSKADRESIKLQPLDIDTLHNIYSIFCMGHSLTLNRKGEFVIIPEKKLTPEHYKYLKEERNLTDEEIEEYGYFSYPKYSFLRPFLAKMKELGYDINTLIRVPGLFYNKEKQSINFKSYRSKSFICIPIKDENGKIRGIQLRADHIEEKQSRYIWMSSTKLDEKKFIGNLSPNAPVDVVYPKIKYPKTIAVTEGHFKAIKISKTLNFLTLSVQGVNNWKHILTTINSLKEKYPSISNVVIMYDADMSYKIPVLQSAIAVGMNIIKYDVKDINYLNYMRGFKIKTNKDGTLNFKYDENKNREIIDLNGFIEARNNFITSLRKFNNFINVNICVWDYNYGKGFDDFIMNTNNLDGLIYLPLSEFMYKLSFILEELLGYNNITKEDFFALFREYFLEEYTNLDIDIKIDKVSATLEKKDGKLDEKGGLEIVHF